MITYDEALGALNKAMEKRGPGYNYLQDSPLTSSADEARCVYIGHPVAPYCDENGELADETQPIVGCIVGEALDQLGLLQSHADVLMNDDGKSAQQLAAHWDFSDKAMGLFVAAQCWQDRGHDWGIAVQKGIDTVEVYSNGLRDDLLFSQARADAGSSEINSVAIHANTAARNHMDAAR